MVTNELVGDFGRFNVLHLLGFPLGLGTVPRLHRQLCFGVTYPAFGWLFWCDGVVARGPRSARFGVMFPLFRPEMVPVGQTAAAAASHPGRGRAGTH